MSKWTDPKWWTGRTEDQRQRRAEAVQGLRDSGQQLRDANAELGQGLDARRARREAERAEAEAQRQAAAEAEAERARQAREAELRAELAQLDAERR